jgi:Zn-dependent peptidase ImmA (M78 family)
MIVNTAMPIIRRFQVTAPVDVTAMAQALGLRVWEDASLPDGIAGKLFHDQLNGGAEGFSIVVRASDPYVRRRFTVAHEIAHFVLHRNAIGSGLTDDAFYRSGLPTTMEAEANQFAADILMPRDLLARYINQYGAEARVLASIFKVSEAAMKIRLS